MGGVPYPDMRVQQVIQFVSDGNRMKKTREIPLSMLRCWDENPAQRPSFDELLGILTSFQDHADDVWIFHNLWFFSHISQKYLQKGSSVLVEGRIRQTKLENESYWTEVVADTVQFLGKTKSSESGSSFTETEEIENVAF